MEIILSRPEFFALMALARAEGVIGLDPAQLLPAEPAQRQALYNQGEADLARRGLLRVTSSQEVALEETLLRQVLAITQPEFAVVSIKTVPAAGRQLFIHYGREGYWVEQTLPDDLTHRLEDIGDNNALLQRLQAIFPLNDAVSAARSFRAPGDVLLAAYNEAVNNRATQEVKALDAADQPGVAAFLHAARQQSFSGSLAFLRVVPVEENEALELAVVCAAQENWLLMAEEAGTLRAGALTMSEFVQVLRAVLTTLVEE